ncbi:MAG: hypothetical protein GXP08_15295 [Gammaproteobacteria bacterium]|nr:hypothetical protein [Gammaproteobacteria bacterium]
MVLAPNGAKICHSHIQSGRDVLRLSRLIFTHRTWSDFTVEGDKVSTVAHQIIASLYAQVMELVENAG